MRDFWVPGEGVRLFAVADGTGPVIVMLHGGMADHGAALPLVSPLAGRFHVVTPDLRANGRSWWGGPLSFDMLADDVAHVLDQVGADRAVIGGVSSGTGVALRFALRHPGRTLGLVMVKPVYAGESRGYTGAQQERFAAMDAIASRALTEGVEVLQPMYASLPTDIREKALAMLQRLDPASVVATSRFLASGAQPFGSAAELGRLKMPVLLVRGDDPMHPPENSDLYASSIPDCTTLDASTPDTPAAIGAFAERVVASLLQGGPAPSAPTQS